MATKWKFVNIWENINPDFAVVEMFCPACKRYTTHVFSLGYNNPLEGMNYCPHCGERMKGEQISEPPIEYAKPIHRGRWIQQFDGARCSVCNHKLQTTGIPSYCPNCGARMDENYK